MIKQIFTLSGLTAIGQFIQLVTLPLITRFYSPSSFGEFTLYSSAIWIVVVVVTMQLEHLIINEPKNRRVIYIYSMSKWLVYLFLPFIYIAYLIANEFFLVIDKVNFSIAVVTIILIASNQSYRYMCIRYSLFSVYGKSVLINSALIAILPLLFRIILSNKLIGELSCLLLSQLTAFLMANVYLRIATGKQIGRLKFRIFMKLLPKLFYRYAKSSLQLTVAHLIKTSYVRMPVFIVSSTANSNSLGNYSLVERIINAPIILLANAYSDVLRSKVANNIRSNEYIFNVLFKSTIFISMAILPFYVIAWLLLPEVIPIIFGDNWADSAVYGQILLVGGYFVFIFMPINSINIVLENNKYLIGWHALRLISKLFLLSLVINLELSVEFALWGLVIIRILFHLVDSVYVFIKCRSIDFELRHLQEKVV